MTETDGRARRRGRNRVILVLLLIASGILAGGAAYYGNSKRQYRTDVERQLSGIAALKVDEIRRYRQERLGDAAILYRNPSFAALVRRYFEHPEDRGERDQIEAWLSHIQTSFQYDRILLLDSQYAKKLIVPDGPERSTSFVSPAVRREPAGRPDSLRGFLLERAKPEDISQNPGPNPRRNAGRPDHRRRGPAHRSKYVFLSLARTLADPQPDGGNPACPPGRKRRRSF